MFGHRFVAATLALMMFLTSFGFSMDMHFCQDRLMGVSLIGKAKTCHEKRTAPPCHHKQKSLEEKNKCCHNEGFVVENIDLDATSPQVSVDIKMQTEYSIPVGYDYVFHPALQKVFSKDLLYRPPIPKRDFCILFQSFLI